MYTLISLSVAGMIAMFLGFLKDRRILLPLTLAFLAIALGLTLYFGWNQPGVYAQFNYMLMQNNFTVGFSSVIIVTALLIMPLSQRLVRNNDVHLAEYYALMIFSLVGAMMMVSYENLLMLFIGVEILSIAMYVLAGSDKRNLRSNEAALKYFLMGAFATGILLFGMAFVYGATGHFNLTNIAFVISRTGNTPLLTIGILLMLVGMLFKVSAAPFHFWTPDVYEGTPTIFTAFMATIVKTAGFAALYRLLSVAFVGVYDIWWTTIAVIAVMTLLIGNITAAYQQSAKRMLAYSSISHAGYLLIALTALSGASQKAILFYSLAYSIASVGAFGVLIAVADAKGNDNYEAFNGLGKSNPSLALIMTVCSLSLAGIPLTAGFFGKFFIFVSALEQNLTWILIPAILMTAVGVYYYFKVIIAMYLKPGDSAEIVLAPAYQAALVVATVATLVLGIMPQNVIELFK
ncbi:MAG: NADH-quinone oxidoreductase subunit N [Verrucomicrobia bacterium]|nr:NADH-quinone oxidoreductase subunit N [Cytophagales bacterium]